jgi:hypothetical protein
MNRSWVVMLLFAFAVSPAFAETLRLQGSLNGGNVVSATDSKATGEMRATLQDDNSVRIDLVFGGLASDVTAASLHTGKEGENGPAAVPLDVRKNQPRGSLVNERLQLTPEVAQRMRAGETYIVISTNDHPDGAIRGQLLPQPVRLGDQVEPEEEGY